MSRFLIATVAAVLLVVGTAACGGNEGAPLRTIEAPEHTIVAVEDTSFGFTQRRSYRIRVPERYSEAQARIIAESLVEANHRRGDLVNAIYFYYYFPGSDPFSWADGAIIWAPDGDWSKASSVKTGDYDSFRFATDFYGGE